MTRAADPLFQDLMIGGLRVPGRVVKSATSETRASETGAVTPALLDFYEPIVAAGTPLIITGNLYVSLQGKSTELQAGIDSDDKLSGLRDWVDLAHQGGSLLFAQLNHGGRQMVRSSVVGQPPVAPSDVREPTFGVRPRPLSVSEIPGIVRSFADAAGRAQEAGFDGIQIHAAHGYLLNEFLTPHTNRRTDEYGGPLRNRMRLLLEVYRATRKRVGDDFPIIAKLNGVDALPFRRGASTAEMVQVATALQDEGLDAVEISAGHYESWPATVLGRYRGFVRAQMTEGAGTGLPPLRRRVLMTAGPLVERTMERVAPGGEGFNLAYAEKFTQDLEIPVICVGGFHTAHAMRTAIATGRCDAVAVGRAMIADPSLYAHLRSPVIRPQWPTCTFCNGCVARVGGRPIDCYDPQTHEKKERMLRVPSEH